MKVSRKVLCIVALIIAGLLSLGASFLGLMGLLWGGFGRHGFKILELLFFLPPLLAFPLFALAAASSRLAAFSLWALGPAYSLAMFQVSAENFVGSFTHYAVLLLACFVNKLAILLWVSAALVQFGIRVYAQSRIEEPASTVGL